MILHLISDNKQPLSIVCPSRKETILTSRLKDGMGRKEGGGGRKDESNGGENDMNLIDMCSNDYIQALTPKSIDIRRTSFPRSQFECIEKAQRSSLIDSAM
jgi:hypothetical protein